MSDLNAVLPVIVPIVFFALFFGGVGYTLYRIVKYGGLRGSLFGSPVRKTVGEIQGKRLMIFNSKMKVHILESRALGVEINVKSFASWQLQPITLERAEAQRLINYLQQAIQETA